MPTKKRRIGYLPSDHVIKQLDELCLAEHMGASKVVDMLVREALQARRLSGSLIDIPTSEATNKEVCTESSHIPFEESRRMIELVSDNGVSYEKEEQINHLSSIQDKPKEITENKAEKVTTEDLLLAKKIKALRVLGLI